MKLTDTKIKALKAMDKLYRVNDGNGLYISIKANNSKAWEFRYTLNGKANWLGFGLYPNVSLKQARGLAQEYRALIANGVDPKTYKDKQKAENDKTLEHIAAYWLDVKKNEFSASHYKQTVSRLNRFILPTFGKRSIDKIEAPEVVRFLKSFEVEGHFEQRNKVKGHLNQIFAYGVASGICSHNPVAGISPVLKVAKGKNYAAVTKPEDIGQLLRDIDNYHGFYTTVMTLKLAPYVMLRPGELAALEWEEIHEDERQIHIKPERMKMRKAHMVPLSKQAWAIIEQMKSYSSNGKYVFPSAKKPNNPVNINSLRLALRAMGYKHSSDSAEPMQEGDKPKHDTHGFRHMASTRLYEMASMYGFHSDMIELQLAHTESNKVKAAYNHAQYIKERTRMMQIWADYLDNLRDGKNVVNMSDFKAG
ncbi:tyrosine-type recombinase/integrase [Cysteiniphilum sp. JM-1]|uniref:tyrosine-type recombinase/integrase n=1 Tax=Cysteiniphilum sp. JM-1 TaxID=2610891 RepID=UPI0012482DBC|nr:integrase arm-type DNA-binding domain-containing protein [Cysteiniphilum sp. JM-1]